MELMAALKRHGLDKRCVPLQPRQVRGGARGIGAVWEWCGVGMEVVWEWYGDGDGNGGRGGECWE